MIALLVLAVSVHAGDQPQVGISARSVGLGGSLTGLANDASAVFWNPSGIPGLQRQELSFRWRTDTESD
jgi:long-subunit fatty acid transport protein